MTPEKLIEYLEHYESELSGILSRFVRTRNSTDIDRNDVSKYQQNVQELIDLFNDNWNKNYYSKAIKDIAIEGVRNFTGSPSFKSVEDILSILRAAITRIKRDPSVIDTKPISHNNQDKNIWELLHPKVVELAKPRFEAGHYADAVEAVLKELNSAVKLIHKSVANEELDGAALMRKAFTPSKPTIILDDLNTDTGRNIQQGHMDLFVGAMIGVRNPKAHGNVVITPERAFHHFFLASLLFIKLDERYEPR